MKLQLPSRKINSLQPLRFLGFFTVFASLLAPYQAFSFPEMVRHGYVNCITCHASPTGGGVLTPYGRELSREVLSHKGKEGEGRLAFGAVTLPEWILAGGDFRFLQLYRDTPSVREARFIPMQADVEAAVTVKTITVVGTLGLQGSPRPPPNQRELFSRRHYLNYKPSDTVSIRSGRFQPAFGINLPDHAVVTKRGLGWDQGSETYNLEAAYLGEELNFYGTWIWGRPDAPALNRETGAALSSSYFFSERYKIGASYFYGQNNTAQRHITGPYGILGFSQHFFLLTEFDFQWYMPKNPSEAFSRGAVAYNRLDYEFFQGFHGFVTQELSQLNFGDSSTASRYYGLGLQYFPRPHFEFLAYWQKQALNGASDFIDVAYLLLHFYL